MNDNLPLMNKHLDDEIKPDGSAFITRDFGSVLYVGMRDGAVKKDEVRTAALRWLSPPIQRLRFVRDETAPMPKSGRVLNS